MAYTYYLNFVMLIINSHVAGGSLASTLIKSCFSCGDDPSQVVEGMLLCLVDSRDLVLLNSFQIYICFVFLCIQLHALPLISDHQEYVLVAEIAIKQEKQNGKNGCVKIFLPARPRSRIYSFCL